MSDLICKKTAVDALWDIYFKTNPDNQIGIAIQRGILASIKTIEQLPTAENPVVRCRDCVHCNCLPDYMGFFYCDFDEGRTVSGNGFCDVGERRQDAQLG